jgi:hypothetical protein
MTPQTLIRANELQATITALDKGIQVASFALSTGMGLRLSVPAENLMIDLHASNPDQAAVITGIKVSLEVHLDSCRKELEKL